VTTRLGALVLAATSIFFAAAGAAHAASAPTAITGPVSAVSPTTATLTGTVNPNGAATTWYFEYGTSTSYGSKTASTNAGSGTANANVTSGLTGLKPATTYHYRLVATNSAGTTRGADGIFSTSASPVATTGAADAVTATSATLTGTVDPNGRATSWYFQYGTSTSYGSKTPVKSAGAGAAPVAVSAPVSGLTRGKTYHFRLVATSDAGTSRGADHTFSTAGAPTATTGSTTSITLTTAKLTGSVNPNGLATTWYFEYGTTASYGTKTAVKSAGSGTKAAGASAPLSGLKSATTYHYRLVATNSAGTSAGADRTFSTAGPPVVRSGAAQEIGPTSAKLTGTVNPRGLRTTWYIEYGTSTSYGLTTPSKSAGSSFADRSVAASISGLRPSTIYHYRVVARNDAGTTRGADLAFTTAGVTLTASATAVVYGRSVMLSGVVPTRRAGELVTIFAREVGGVSPHSLASVVTDATGTWRLLARPTILTYYLAGWNGGFTPETVVGVRPSVSFRALAGRRFKVRVAGSHSFAGRSVKLQRQTAGGRWVTVKRVRLGRNSGAIFRARLPRGRSVLRIAMSVNQAGFGYLAGFSRTITVRRS
jgi:hypothetical protein